MGKPLSAGALEALNQCTVDGNVIKLGPGQLDRNVYVEVKSALDGIGGSWKGGKVYGFVFDHDPAELLEDLQGGIKRNLKKEFQFFATNPKRAVHLVDLAEFDNSVKSVLEPSAGDGALVKAILSRMPSMPIQVFELMPQNRDKLTKIDGCNIIGDDFLNTTFPANIKFDRIIANPPFSNNQDIDHIYEMYRRLAENGVMVSIASNHWKLSGNKKESDFKQWLTSKNAYLEDIPTGDFNESGTNVATCIIKIRKS